MTTTITSTQGSGNLGTVVTPSGNTYNITGGTRPGGGANLFHSFGNFSVGAGDIANFQNTLVNGAFPATSNILARVTGGNISNIFGTIQTTNFGNANLFLMNPAGFLFGPTAAVNVGGMVAFTSGDYLRLSELNGSNAGIFHADPAKASVLTTAPVAAFGFLGSNPGAITVQGSTLSVSNGQSLSLVGGDITIQSDPTTGATATLTAPGGRINLASVASPGEILFPSFQPAPNVNNQSFTSLGTITLSELSFLDVSDAQGGTISIRGGKLVMDSAGIFADTQGDLDGAPTAVNINVTGDVSLDNFSVISATAQGAGRSGDVLVNANNLIVTGLSSIGTFTNGSGQAGNVTVTATGSITIDGTDGFGNFSNISSQASNGTTGNGGKISLSAPSVILDNQGIIQTSTSGSGRAGDIALDVGTLTLQGGGVILTQGGTAGPKGGPSGTVTVNADTVSIVGAPQLNDVQQSRILNLQSDGVGGGDIAITARNVMLSEGGRIRLDNFSSGPSGTISVSASDSITISNTARIASRALIADAGPVYLSAPLITLSQQGSVSTRSAADNNAGAIRVTGDKVSLSGASEIVSASEQGAARGGPITISASDSLTVSGGSVISSSSQSLTSQSAGPITVTAGNLVSLTGTGTALLSETNGAGAGGSIALQAPQVQITDGAVISAKSTGSGAAGNVTIQGLASSAQSAFIEGAGSGLFTTTSGSGAGGNIVVNANTVTLQNGGTLSASTSGTDVEAKGGTITVTAGQVNLTNGGLITASTTGAGDGGSITIGAGSTFASNTSTVSSTAAQAQGGDITITAGQSVTLNNGSLITASSSGPGNAGNIAINAGQNYTSTDSAVTTQAAQASGGNITLLATGTVQLSNSQLNASVQGSSTTVGGNITIDPQYVILLNSQILAQATQGQGGAISINIANGGLYLPDANSTVSASSQFGVDGIVTIQSPNAPAGGKIIPLSQKPLLATSLLNQRCASLAGGQFSSFTVAGRDSLPTEPGGWLASPMALSLGGTGGGALAEKGGRTGMDEDPAHETTVLSLRQIAPAGFLTQSFAVEGSAGCQS